MIAINLCSVRRKIYALHARQTCQRERYSECNWDNHIKQSDDERKAGCTQFILATGVQKIDDKDERKNREDCQGQQKLSEKILIIATDTVVDPRTEQCY